MKELVDFIKNKCSQEEIAELVKELSVKEETKKTDVPKTWKEYGNGLTEGYYINASSDIDEACCSELYDADQNKNVLPTREMAYAFLAMMQLMSLRQAWIDDWEPNWYDAAENKYCIVITENSPKIDVCWACNRTLSFPTNEMAEDFLNCFGSLIVTAKILI